MVAFNSIPGNLLVPFFYAEINSGGSPYEGTSRLLLLGQKLAAGSAAAGIPVGPIQSERDVIALCGNGSMLVDMYRIARQNAPFQPIWLLPVADPAGAAAGATITLTAPGVTGVGVVSIAGVRLALQVNAADTAATIATNLRDLINNAGIPVSATAATNVVTLASRHVGTVGNGLEVRVRTEEPNVFTTTNALATAMASGTGVPTLTTALANLGDDEFDWIAAPFADTVSLDAVRDFLSDTGTGRWSPVKQLYGHYITALFGTLSTLVTAGNARNDRHVSIIGSQASPSPVWSWAAAVAAQAAAHLTDAPEVSRPLQTLPLAGILPPTNRGTWWSIVDRQALYIDGVSGYKVTIDGIVTIDRIVTTEQVNGAGVPDATFRNIETIGQMMFGVRYLKVGFASRHARQALADDNPAGLAEITTPRDLKNTAVHLYRDLVNLGVFEKPELFAEFVVSERDGNNSDRVNLYLPVDVVNQLRVLAANVTTFLQYAA